MVDKYFFNSHGNPKLSFFPSFAKINYHFKQMFEKRAHNRDVYNYEESHYDKSLKLLPTK